MGMTPEVKKKLDQRRAQDWLEEHGHVRALGQVLNLKVGQVVRVGMTGRTTRLEVLMRGSKANWTAQAVAGYLIGDGYLRPVTPQAAKPSQKKPAKKRRGRGAQVERPTACTLTRKGYGLLLEAGHPREDVAPAG